LGLQFGSAQAWREGLRRPCKYSDYLVFAASVAFSGPLFELAAEQEGVVFHFQPQNREDKQFKTKSSSGKTMAARVAISTIGRALKSDLISFAVTLRASEDYGFSHNNLVGVLDEEGRALVGSGRHISASQLPYQLTSGRGTLYSNKATKDSDLRNLTWSLPFISTGEQPLDDPKRSSGRMEGAQVRMAPIPVPAGRLGGIFNCVTGSSDEIVEQAYKLARLVEETLTQNYGVAMPAYLEQLVSKRSELEPRVRRIMDKFVKWVGADTDPWERRFAEKFGIVAAGAIFASEFEVAPWTKKRAAKAIREIYQLSRAASASVSQATDAVINDLREALSVNRFPRVDKGQTINPQDAGTAWGVTRKSPKHGMIFALTLPRLKSLIRPQALASEVIDEMAKRTILHKDPDGNAARELMIRGLHGSKRRRYVVLSLSALMNARSG
jgi:hypothetical protein